MLREGNVHGIDALKSAGARQLTLEELVDEEGQLTRIAVQNGIKDDGFGEYFGGGKVEGTDDILHRVLGPRTTEYGKTFVYEFDDETSLSDAEEAALGLLSKKKWKDVWVDGDGLNGQAYKGEIHIVPLETHAADWFDQEGGAKQISFYLTDADGHILIKDSEYMRKNNIPPQLYKLTRDQLVQLGILKQTW